MGTPVLKRRWSNSIANLGNDAPPGAASMQSGSRVAGIAMRESAAGPLMDQRQVCARLYVSRITLWRMVKAGKFPPPVDTGKRRAIWRGTDVNAWCKANALYFEKVLKRVLPAALHR